MSDKSPAHAWKVGTVAATDSDTLTPELDAAPSASSSRMDGRSSDEVMLDRRCQRNSPVSLRQGVRRACVSRTHATCGQEKCNYKVTIRPRLTRQRTERHEPSLWLVKQNRDALSATRTRRSHERCRAQTTRHSQPHDARAEYRDTKRGAHTALPAHRATASAQENVRVSLNWLPVASSFLEEINSNVCARRAQN